MTTEQLARLHLKAEKMFHLLVKMYHEQREDQDTGFQEGIYEDATTDDLDNLQKLIEEINGHPIQ